MARAATASLATQAFQRLWAGFRPATLASYERMFHLFMAFLVVLDLFTVVILLCLGIKEPLYS